MLPHTLLYTFFIATSSTAWFLPRPSIPRPATPQIIEPIAPAPNPYRPADRPDPNKPEATPGFQAPKPTGGVEVPDVPLPDDNSQDETASKVLSRPYGNPAKTLSPAQVAASRADSGPTATPTTGMTVPATTGGAMRIEGVGLRMLGGVVGLASAAMKMICEIDG
ncbi:hypothetical protein BKA58DRAFT_401479 [Alternaria rosae]|uniref:uncharacterized protein n=1 Tax=Alternaria rosae TaxID=1187941 RepID=UPI001E8E8D77|nr:uncharacterized protein BKA58DRAFT_401479 [Alternaria rosae]KAH6873370.1 hypothetical protein BKA58DRAFT_401479 [Alternaria rosae]